MSRCVFTVYGNVLKWSYSSTTLLTQCIVSWKPLLHEGQPRAEGERPSECLVNTGKWETNRAVQSHHLASNTHWKKKIIHSLKSWAWLLKPGGIATLVNLQKYFYNFIRGFNSVLYLPLLVCKIALNIQVVINESFMLQIKHFHLRRGTVAAGRRGLKCNCFSRSPRSAECLFTLYYIIGFCFSSSALRHILSFDICCLCFNFFFFGSRFLTAPLPETFLRRWKLSECGIFAWVQNNKKHVCIKKGST